MELYDVIAIVDRNRAEQLRAVFQSAGTSLILSRPGRGTASGEQLARYELEATEKAVVSTVADRDQVKTIFRAARRDLYMDIPGNGILMTVPLKAVANRRALRSLTTSEIKGGIPPMEFEHELLVVILNEGYADQVMDAARAAGAGGGTLMHAKGTGGPAAEKFFSVSLADEKDLIYIVAHRDEKAAIMREISRQAGPDTKAGAICFSLPISAVAGLRSREEPQ